MYGNDGELLGDEFESWEDDERHATAAFGRTFTHIPEHVRQDLETLERECVVYTDHWIEEVGDFRRVRIDFTPEERDEFARRSWAYELFLRAEPSRLRRRSQRMAPAGSERPARSVAAAPATLRTRSAVATASSSSASVPGSRAARQSGSLPERGVALGTCTSVSFGHVKRAIRVPGGVLRA